ncbi:unnamed protein product [Tilletia controversa]|uniref:Ubiquitin carboxyl-terminal hydrolase n=1 Tax=Tilletia controversa TaxID=13291 RepID=A0A8X7N1V1_9BASI|nr:hypothetical protein CF336_g7618 [Tilletia laevis]KAE8190286.1 hypothetical protein CF328_g6022 [Tilletia controversa]KAE8255494.1 hypothetical protein A4X06_0g397 [Tilletia controversa]CAD6921436.1 unnamed protein product [Tilletia laevis]CAD6921910.1 unnamed protein product [Tilletia controversa]
MAHSDSQRNPIKWVPLEANPDTFNAWASTMGLKTSQLAYHDIFGTDPDLLSMIPQPVQAVLLLFPINEAIAAFRRGQDEGRQELTTPEAGDPPLLWFKQTIGNACGTIGLLHSIASSPYARSHILPASPLSQLLADAAPLTPLERASYLESSQHLQTTHASAAQGGQTSAPAPEDPVDLHFVCFVRHAGRLVELDGDRKGPVDHGVRVDSQEELLGTAVKWIQENYMTRAPDSINFNLIALAPAQA